MKISLLINYYILAAILPFYASSPKKRKREDNASDEEETKSRKKYDPADTSSDMTGVSKDPSLNEVFHPMIISNVEYSLTPF